MNTESSKGNSVETSNWRGNDKEICLRCGADRMVLREMITRGDKSNLTIVNHILEGCPSCKRALGGNKDDKGMS